MLPHILLDYRIAASIINCFFLRLAASKESDCLMARAMVARLEKPNKLERTLLSRSFVKSNPFVEVASEDLQDFPRLTSKEIEMNITFGEYQLEQGIGYIREHLDKNGDIKLLLSQTELNSDSRRIVFCKLHSRHKSSTIYKVYLLYNPSDKTVESIFEWYCTCKVGARTLGCCSHVAALIYYLAFWRHQTHKSSIKYTSNIQNSKLSQVTSNFFSNL
jgi:hypothetical protein